MINPVGLSAAARWLLVVGMHRGGTSAVAGVLDHLGWSIGRSLMPATADNPRGYFENSAIAGRHDRIMLELGTAWHLPTPLPPDWSGDLPMTMWVEQLNSLIGQEFAPETGCRLVKDPRLSRLLPIWDRLLGERGESGAVLLVVRHPAAVVQSLVRRDGVTIESGLWLWLQYMLDAELHSRSWDRRIVGYPQLLDHWRQWVTQLDDWIAMPALADQSGAYHAIDQLIDPSMDHGIDASLPSGLLTDLALECHELLHAEPIDPSACDRLREQLVDWCAGSVLAESRRLTLVQVQRADQLEKLVHHHEQRRLELSERVAVLDRQLSEQHGALADARANLRQLQADADYYRAVVDSMTRSRSWRWTRAMRLLGDLTRHRREHLKGYGRFLTRARIGKALGLLLRGRFGELRRRWQFVDHLARARGRAVQVENDLAVEPMTAYQSWLAVNTPGRAERERLMVRLAAQADVLPLVSIVMPVYQVSSDLLDAAIQSLLRQWYQRWELCIVFDAGPDESVWQRLEYWAGVDARIRIARRDTNGGIANATNDAIAESAGDWLVFMDQDDLLADEALAYCCEYLLDHPDCELLYSDDDKIDLQGRRFDPQFKPDYSPQLLLGFMYFSHLVMVRRALVESVGGLRPAYDGSQDYDLMLRLTEQTAQVGHVPRVLYHWRAVPGSTAMAGNAKPAGFEAGRRAVADALSRRGIGAEVVQPAWARDAGCGIFEPCFADTGPAVTILIPTYNGYELLVRCIESIQQKTRYDNYQIVVIDNGSDDRQTIEYLQSIEHKVIHIPQDSAGFNFAAINNQAVPQVDSPYILFLNNDTEVCDECWLSAMMGWMQMSGVGVVGARLLFPDGTIQHAGITHGLYHGLAGPAFKGQPAGDYGYLSLAKVTRNCMAVTAACMLTDRWLFLSLGGFDADRFAVAYNDVDYCYRVVDAGRQVVYCAQAELLHHEGATRGFSDRPEEPAAFRRLYRDRTDPYVSAYLSRDHERMSITARCLARRRRPIRVAMFGHGLNHEGASNSQLELTVALRDRGVIEPVVMVPQSGPLAEVYQREQIEVVVHAHPLAGVSDLSGYQSRCRSIGRLLADWDVELVYANTLQSFYGIDLAKQWHLPSIWNVRESEPWDTYYDYAPPAVGRAALRCFAWPYAVVFVSDATRGQFEPLHFRHHFHTIHNGLNPDRLPAAMAEVDRTAARSALGMGADVVFLSVGTICARKGQLDAISAFALLPDQLAHQSQLWLVGDRAGDYSRALHQAVGRLVRWRRERIHVIGECADVSAYYRAADVFVMCSRLESYPRVILEAMCAGLPILTTGVCGVVEQVAERENGLFYVPGEVTDLALKMQWLIENRPDRLKMARASERRLAVLTDFGEMVQQYATLFTEAAWVGVSR